MSFKATSDACLALPRFAEDLRELAQLAAELAATVRWMSADASGNVQMKQTGTHVRA